MCELWNYNSRESSTHDIAIKSCPSSMEVPCMIVAGSSFARSVILVGPSWVGTLYLLKPFEYRLLAHT